MIALLAFLVSSSLWLVGITYFALACVRIEGPNDPNGELGAFAGTGWLRGSTAESRRYRTLALGWGVVGSAAVVFVTSLARLLESA